MEFTYPRSVAALNAGAIFDVEWSDTLVGGSWSTAGVIQTILSDNGTAPSRNASNPQARTCAECPQSAWGSKVSTVSGKGVKACADIQKIAFRLSVDANEATPVLGTSLIA